VERKEREERAKERERERQSGMPSLARLSIRQTPPALPRLFVIFIENYKFNHRSTLPRSGIRITQ